MCEKNVLKDKITAVFFGCTAFVMMLLIGLPVLPSAAFLKYEPSGAVLLLASVLLGLPGGLLACFTKDFLFLMAGAGNIFGVVSDFLATVAFVLPAGALIRNSSGLLRGRLLGYAVGIAVSTLLMIPVNLVILQMEFGMSYDKIMGMMIPAILPFNLLKGLLNVLVFQTLGQPVMKGFARLPSSRLCP